FGLDNGITTLFGGGTGPADGSNATTCTPGKFHITRMLQAVDDGKIFSLPAKTIISGACPPPEPSVWKV
ncbi:hypothetical protein, partial [Streptococcus salivarius]|uniref:hypothetical protein n=1 Tax=Streptococcus salivarius TaxID=1304 RepID=UPI0019191241